MKFCMVTTFFGGHSFGGDAAYVDRLCQALCRRGHEVHVLLLRRCLQRGARRPSACGSTRPPPGLHLHPLESGYGILSPLATQATGLPLFKSKALGEAPRCARHRRRAFPQHLARRRARRPGPGDEPPGRRGS